MSLSSFYHRKAVASQFGDVDANTNTIHVWTIMWLVEIEKGIIGQAETLLFNPATNLDSARNDPATTTALYSIAHCNIVHHTRIKFCDLPIQLVYSRPQWSKVQLDEPPLRHLKMCDRCRCRVLFYTQLFDNPSTSLSDVWKDVIAEELYLTEEEFVELKRLTDPEGEPT